MKSHAILKQLEDEQKEEEERKKQGAAEKPEDPNRIKQVSQDYKIDSFNKMIEYVEEQQDKIEAKYQRDVKEKLKQDALEEAQRKAEIEEFKRMQEELRLAEEKKEEEKNAEEHDQDKSHDEEETKDGIRITSKIGVEEIKPTGKKAVTFDTSEIQTVDSKAFEETKKKEMYRSILGAQQDLFMKQYDIEWGEIKQRTTQMLKDAINPYILRVHDVEKVLACSVRDIRNQENVLGDL